MTVFLDSNIVLYAIGDDEQKRSVAVDLLLQTPVISTQVINECSHVMRRKYGLSVREVTKQLDAILVLVTLVDVGLDEIRQAWDLAIRYEYSHFDNLILATALASDCSELMSEDMQHGQCIENRLTIVNPFK